MINRVNSINIQEIPKLSGYTEKDLQQVRDSAEQFEAIFVEIMLKSMRASVEKSGMLDGGNGEDVFRGMLDFEYAKSMASQRSSGLASSIEKQLLGVSQDLDHLLTKSRGDRRYKQFY